MWRATVLTLFPDLFPGPLGASLAGKALAAKLLSWKRSISEQALRIATERLTTPRRAAVPAW